MNTVIPRINLYMDMMNTNDINSPFWFPFEDELDMIKKKNNLQYCNVIVVKNF